jgi:hypothetical protein
MPDPSPPSSSRSANRPPLGAIAAGFTACVAALLAVSGLPASGQRPAIPAGSGQLVVSTSPLPDARHLVVVVDPGTRHAAAYVVDADGTLALKSARDLTWDLMVGEFNAQEPRPAAIRKLLEAGQPPR